MGLEHVNDVDSLWMHKNRSIMDPLTRCIDATVLLRRPLDILVFILSESQIRNGEIGPHCKDDGAGTNKLLYLFMRFFMVYHTILTMLKRG